MLKDDKQSYHLTHNGVPKIIKISLDRGLKLVEYYSGSYGTTKTIRVQNLMVIKDTKVIVDAPFKYLNQAEQPVWKINHVSKTIEISDPRGTNRKVIFK